LTPAEQHAFESTTQGGVKAASLAGAIFNYKDDKKEQQDTFKWWFRETGIAIALPDTSNNHYGTYCEVAGAMDGKEWEKPNVVDTINKPLNFLIHLMCWRHLPLNSHLVV
jgi:hypothetical protein